MYDVLIVGGGVAGRTLAYVLCQKYPSIHLLLLESSVRPSCSLHSLGVVSTFGVKPGTSERGDKICAAFERAETFFEKMCPSGVERVPHLFAQKKKSHYCYLIAPATYLAWLEENTPCEYGEEYVVEVADGKLRTDSGKIFEARSIVLASGAYIKKDGHLFPHHRVVGESSVVKGSYGFFERVDWGEDSFVFSMDGANLIYRGPQKRIVIGGTTDSEEGQRPHRPGVEELYHSFATFFDLPPFKEIQLGAGLRHRGRKRMPFWGELSENIYGIFGLYKNGWTLAFAGADAVMLQLKNKSVQVR